MLTLISPAKINLFFRVLCKRADGYHEIASLMQAINLSDELTIIPSNVDSLECTVSEVPLDDSNLILKAAALFRQKTGLASFARYSLIKKIPMQAGLGGGSSNAATALWGLNELAGRPATLLQLQEWGSLLGSDVPFFLSHGRAYCTGRGEVMQHQPHVLGKCWIVKPPQASLATPLVYRHCKPDQMQQRDPLQALISCATHDPEYFNDLEEAAFHLCPELVEVKQRVILAGLSSVTMTGSGSAFFGFGVPSKAATHSLDWYQCEFVNRSEGSWY